MELFNDYEKYAKFIIKTLISYNQNIIWEPILREYHEKSLTADAIMTRIKSKIWTDKSLNDEYSDESVILGLFEYYTRIILKNGPITGILYILDRDPAYDNIPEEFVKEITTRTRVLTRLLRIHGISYKLVTLKDLTNDTTNTLIPTASLTYGKDISLKGYKGRILRDSYYNIINDDTEENRLKVSFELIIRTLAMTTLTTDAVQSIEWGIISVSP